MINYEEFNQRITKAHKDHGPEYALGLVEGLVETIGVTTRMEDRFSRMNDRVAKLELDAQLQTQTPIAKYTEAKAKKHNEKKKIVSKPTKTKRVKFTSEEARTKILNALKTHDYLNTKDLLSMTHIPYPSLIAKLNLLEQEEKVVKTLRGPTKKRGYNWSLPEDQKVAYTLRTGGSLRE